MLAGEEGRELMAVFMLPTLYCNFHCSYCFTEFHPEFRLGDKTEIAADLLLDLVDAVRKVRYDVLPILSGGEPLLYSEIRPLLRGLDSRAEAVHFTTNWTYLDRDAMKFMSELPSLKVYLSCHGRLRELTAFIEEHRDAMQFSYVVSQVVTRRTLPMAEELARRCRQLGVKFLPQMLGPHDSPRMVPLAFPSFSEDEKRRALSLFAESDREKFLSRWDHWYSTGSILEGCPIDNRALMVYASGNVYPCFFRHDAPIGNLRLATPDDILARHRQMAIDVKRPACAKEQCNCLYRVPKTSGAYTERPLWGRSVD